MLKKRILILTYIIVIMSISLFAQYGVDWTIEFLDNFIGCEDTDGDGSKELVFGNNDYDNILIVDPITGTIEWDSGDIDFSYANTDPNTLSRLIDVDNDGIYEILFRKNTHGYQDWGLIKYTGSIASDPNSIGEYKQILHQNFPNPFNPKTTIDYHLKKSGYVELKIYNVKGQLVQTLVKEEQPTGKHSAIWNAKGFSSGQYFYQISIDGKAVQTKKAICLK